MKRRQAIKRLGVGFGTAWAGSAWLMNCKPEDPAPEIQYDGTVAIIGAGAAGLYAADLLATKGIKVIVLEASNQIGGRIRSLRNQEDTPYQSIADFPVELGAEFFQGTDSTLGKLIANLNLATIDLTTTSPRFILGDAVKDADGWAGDSDFTSVQNFVSGLPNYSGGATSVRNASGVSDRGQPLLNGMVGNFYGSSNDRIGAQALADQMKLIEHDRKPLMLKNNTMQDLIISRFSDISAIVRTNAPVKSINYSNVPVVITLEDGSTVECTKVIVTVPLPVLKTGITFSPSLPASKTGALNSIGFDPSIRVVLDFKKNFWGNDAGFIFGGEVAPFYFNAGVQRSEFFRTLTVTVNGPAAAQLSALGSDQQIVEAILAELDAVYNGQATAFIRRELPDFGEEPTGNEPMIYFVQDWTKEQYVGGGSSYPLVSTTQADREALAADINKTVFFAGEATDLKGEPGTVNGALNSAERVAEDVVKSILEVS